MLYLSDIQKSFNKLIIAVFLVAALFLFSRIAFAQDAPIVDPNIPNQPAISGSGGGGQGQLQSPPPQPQESAMQPKREQAPSMQPMSESENDPRDFVDPREVKEVLKQIKDIKREANRLVKKAKKLNLTEEINQLNEILSQVSNLEINIKNTSSESIDRDILQDFYDSQIWDKLNDIRVKIELPDEIKMMERDIKRLEKIITRKSFAVPDGVDVNKVKAKVEAIKNAIQEAKNNLAAGNLEDARESLQSIHEEGAHPGEMMGVLSRLSDIARQAKKIKSEEIRNEVMGIIKPVIDAVASDDYREANMLLNEIDQDLWRILSMVKSKSSLSEDIKNRIQSLEEKLQMKMENEGERNIENSKRDKQVYFEGRGFGTSFLGSILDALSDWFDFLQ
ncbi:hypothetical protein HY227_01455 [Candidatus Wolfebacteria bacterium]|nr:hypothetical protein [Candidatus Wolfebacteria bacterium]